MSMDRKINTAPILDEPLASISQQAPSHIWMATVLTTDEGEQSIHWDQNEAWKWCLSRVAALGKLTSAHARLVSLLGWSPAQVNKARDMAWDCLQHMHCSWQN